MKPRAIAALIFVFWIFALVPQAGAVNAPSPPPVFGWEWPDDFPEPPMVKRDKRSVAVLARLNGLSLPLKNPWVLVEKSKFKLSLYDGEVLIKSYPVSFGFSPYGDKVREGDGRTPEGDFYICQKAVLPQTGKNKFLGTRWMRISYPNAEHALRGLKSKLITQAQYDRIIEALNRKGIPPQYTSLGGGLGIHGGTFDYNGVMVRTWTLGCIGLYNSDVEELYRYLPLGALVRIVP